MAGRFDSSMFGCSKMINQNKQKTDLEQEPGIKFCTPSVTSDYRPSKQLGPGDKLLLDRQPPVT